MAVRLLSEEAATLRSQAILALSQEWTAEQIAAGVDGPVPPGRKEGSDYNQHVPMMEAPGAAQDQFFAQFAQIIAETDE